LMGRFLRLVPVLLLAVVFLPTTSARSQGAPAAMAPLPSVIISLYHVAPGKHLEFLKWLAANEVVDHEAGLPASQLYYHTNGDTWDYLLIAPDLTKEQTAKQDQ